MPTAKRNSVVIPTREHRAWEIIKERIDYLNGFAGNRSELAKVTKEIESAWDRAGECGVSSFTP
jgi:hypothetical protein